MRQYVTNQLGDDQVPKDRGWSRRRVLAAGGGALAAVGGSRLMGLPNAHADDGAPEVIDLGPGAGGLVTFSGLAHDGVFYVGLRNSTPVYVVGYDPAAGAVTRTFEVGSNGMVSTLAEADGVLYTGNPLPGALQPGEKTVFQVDLSSSDPDPQPLSRPRFTSGQINLATAPDGALYATGRPADLYEIDRVTGEATLLGRPDPNGTKSRALAVSSSHVFLGTENGLFAIDRASTSVQQVALPDGYRAGSGFGSLTCIDDELYLGTITGLAVLSTTDFSVIDTEPVAKVVRGEFVLAGDDVYFATPDGLYRYSRTGRSLAHVSVLVPGSVPAGVGYIEGTVFVAMNGGSLVAHDTATSTDTIESLSDLGAPVTPLLGNSIAAGGGRVYVGATELVAMHGASGQGQTSLRVPGEAKSMLVVDDVLFAPAYPANGLWTFRPELDEQPQKLFDFPDRPSGGKYDRPWDTVWDPIHEKLLLTLEASAGGGAFIVYDPVTGQRAEHLDPFGEEERLTSLTLDSAGVAYFASERANRYQGGNQPVQPGHLTCWEPTQGSYEWAIEPDLDGGVIRNVVAAYGLVYGLSYDPVNRVQRFFAIDPQTQIIVHQEVVPNTDHIGSGQDLLLGDGCLYRTSRDGLYRIDLATYESEELLGSLGESWYGRSDAVLDDNGDLLTLKDKQLIKVVLAPQPLSSAEAVIEMLAGKGELSQSQRHRMEAALKVMARAATGRPVNAAWRRFVELVEQVSPVTTRASLLAAADAVKPRA